MSSLTLEIQTSFLLESGMDFRDHWLAHFKEAVDTETAAAGGRVADGYKAVGLKIEKTKDTVYQHYKQKSGKVFPTVEMMVLLEKKYGNGRPVGWSSLPVGSCAAAEKVAVEPVLPTSFAQSQDLDQALSVIAMRFEKLPEERQTEAAERLKAMALAPDSPRALESLRVAMGEIAEPAQRRANGI